MSRLLKERDFLMTSAITSEQLKNYQKDLDTHAGAQVAERAVTKNGILATSSDYRSEINMNTVFSIDLDTGKVANQKQSGRCWMFAALNTMRHDIHNNFKVSDDFELSQS